MTIALAGDYRAAGKTGIQTLLIAVATAITLGEGAAALAGGKGAGTAAIANAENAALKNAAKEGALIKGAAGGERAGQAFGRAGKREVKAENAATHDGQTTCMNCGRATVPAQQSKRGVRPPDNETHVDHIIPKSKSGNGSPDNGQVLCRNCNLQKGAKSE